MGKRAEVLEEPISADVVLKNRGRMVCFNLPCNQWCADECACTVHEQVVEQYNARHGEHVRRLVERKICQSLTFAAGEEKKLPQKVLRVREIQAAVDRGDLIVVS